jgi:GrpB-like predicted nucleotidyltransferase (UPF0157 family)
MAISGKPVLIEDYAPTWMKEFEHLAQVYTTHLNGLITAIEHIGSTAVPGLCAKPVIDIDIVIDSRVQLNGIIPILTGLGYEYLGEVAIPDRFVFRPSSTFVPKDHSGRVWQKHHLYCCLKGSAALRNHLILRDALKNDEILAQEYGALKKRLARASNNMDEYVMGKTKFITAILATGGMSDRELLAIEQQNKSVIPPLSKMSF